MGKKVLVAGLGFVVLVLLGQLIFNYIYNFPKQVEYGVTFSPQYAKYLGLNWKEIYIKMLDELKVDRLRLPSYWEDIEKQRGNFNFEDEDFMLDEAGKRGAKIILVVGVRQPRWPECHLPSWAMSLSLEQKRAKILQFVQQVVERYKNNDAIEAIQVENEPFLPYFGENCDKGDKRFLKTEVELVRSLTNKPIIVSDSGELGSWIVPMQTSDIFGTTLYRDVYNPLMGYISYPILPYFYNLKSWVIRRIFAPENQKTVIVELQAEPWLASKDLQRSPEKQATLFSLKKLQSYINYAEKTGFDEIYLWGVEWWIWLEEHGHPEYLDFIKTLL
ncbi:MAG: Uncharacterized protein G01um10147_270 [Microgenomates group bacterium Gr01-1014_7]|nr:MAG: Uncharacterized protein G01um10147_270 [Microgenomates group bacterium Gr01-1014_7]